MSNPVLVEKTYAFTDSQNNPYNIDFVRPGAHNVQLVSFTQNPAVAIALATRGYTGVYSPVMAKEEIAPLLEDIVKTKLQTPLEFVQMLWLLNDVSRAFTHQLVRYRVGTSFVQESMRFMGAQGTYRVLNTLKDGNYSTRRMYYNAAITAITEYHAMVIDGVPPQDARGVLPTNILTHIWFSCSLRKLRDIIPQRLCCQAQPGEWQEILKNMRELVTLEMGGDIRKMLDAPYELGVPCGYRASMDRPCIWQEEN